MKIGDCIKDRREQLGYSLRETARKAEISHPYLSQIETGKNTKPSAEILFKLSNALDINVISLFYCAGYISKEQYENQQQIKLSENELREHLYDLFSSLSNKDNGFFYPYIRRDIINIISNSINVSIDDMVDFNSFLNKNDKRNYKIQLKKFYSSREEQFENVNINEIFNNTYTPQKIKTLIESNLVEYNYEKIKDLFNSFLHLIKQNYYKLEEDNNIDLYDIMLKPNVKYKDFRLTKNDKEIFTAYFDGYFSKYRK